MTRAVFQAGLSWAGIARHWPAYLRAFEDFDVQRVALYGEADVERLMQIEGILHSSRKIHATIDNARTLLEIDRSRGGFQAHLRSFSDYPSLSKDIRKNFKFMGEMNVWYLLFLVGEPVPVFERWVRTIPGEHPRMQEMVEKARRKGLSTEY